jgi:hypothetical protein
MLCAFGLSLLTCSRAAATAHADLQAEIRSLKAQIAAIDRELSEIRNSTRNNAYIFVYYGSAGWRSWRTADVRRYVQRISRMQNELQRNWNLMLRNRQWRVNDLLNKRAPQLQQQRAQLVKRLRRIEEQLNSWVTVPNVIGFTWKRAREALASRGLGVRWQYQTTTNRSREGYVCSSSPGSGRPVARGSTVTAGHAKAWPAFFSFFPQETMPGALW